MNPLLGWGAVWLLRATNNTQKYKPILDALWCEDNYQGQNSTQFSWDDKYAGNRRHKRLRENKVSTVFACRCVRSWKQGSR